jgi:hypothetical protein
MEELRHSLMEIKSIFLKNNLRIFGAYGMIFCDEDFKIFERPIVIPETFSAYGYEFCQFVSMTSEWPIDFGRRLVRPIEKIGFHSSDEDIDFLRFSVDLSPTRDEFGSEDLLWKREQDDLLIIDQGGERERLVILKGGEVGWLSPDGFKRYSGLISALHETLISNLQIL